MLLFDPVRPAHRLHHQGGGDRDRGDDPARSWRASTRLALDAIDRGLEAAARTLGASRADVFASVTLPLMAPGVLAAAAIGFTAALGEFGAVIVFAANIEGETRTLPLAIYTALQVPGGESAAARIARSRSCSRFSASRSSEWLNARLRLRLGLA